MLQKTTRINMLYDFYHRLLTKKQMEYMELYYREDYSLGEIAQHADVSRQAIYDTLNRTEKLLEMYEKKLQLFEKFMMRKEKLNKLKDLIHEKNIDVDAIKGVLHELNNLN